MTQQEVDANSASEALEVSEPALEVAGVQREVVKEAEQAPDQQGLSYDSMDQREELATRLLQAAYAEICKTVGGPPGRPLPTLPELAQLAAQLGCPTQGLPDGPASTAMQLPAAAEADADVGTAQAQAEVPELAGQDAGDQPAAAEAAPDEQLPSQWAWDTVLGAGEGLPLAEAQQQNGSGSSPPLTAPQAQQLQHLQGMAADATALGGSTGPPGSTRKRAAEAQPEGEDDSSRRKRPDTRAGADVAAEGPSAVSGVAVDGDASAVRPSSAAAISSLVSTLEQQVNADLAQWNSSHDGAILDAAAAKIATASQELVAQSAAPGAQLGQQPPLDMVPTVAGTPGSAGQAPASEEAVAAALAKIEAINSQVQQAAAVQYEVNPPGSIHALLAAKFACHNARFEHLQPGSASPGSPAAPLLLPPPAPGGLAVGLHAGAVGSAAHTEAARVAALNATLTRFQQAPAALGPGAGAIGHASAANALEAKLAQYSTLPNQAAGAVPPHLLPPHLQPPQQAPYPHQQQQQQYQYWPQYQQQQVPYQQQPDLAAMLSAKFAAANAAMPAHNTAPAAWIQHQQLISGGGMPNPGQPGHMGSWQQQQQHYALASGAWTPTASGPPDQATASQAKPTALG